MTEEKEEHYRKNSFCRFCEKNIGSDKVRDHCQLTGKYRRPAQNKSGINTTQKQSSCIPFVFHIFTNFDWHLFLKS